MERSKEAAICLHEAKDGRCEHAGDQRKRSEVARWLGGGSARTRNSGNWRKNKGENKMGLDTYL